MRRRVQVYARGISVVPQKGALLRVKNINPNPPERVNFHFLSGDSVLKGVSLSATSSSKKKAKIRTFRS